MHNEPVKTITRVGHFENGAWINAETLKIYVDEDAESPRECFDHFGHMICFHRRYKLGDKNHGIDEDDFSSWDEMEQHLINEIGAVVILPIYMYDHSGITISTTSFSCRFDSGQIGFIYVTSKDILENWMESVLTADLKEKARNLLRGEVKEYDDFLTGNVYGYVLEDENGENIDSCWGFYGDDAIDEIKSEMHIHSTKPATPTQVA